MERIDETDASILRMLYEDARRPYSEIAERTGVSQPTVSNRVERLRDLGVIERFTLALDQSILHDGIQVLIDIDAFPDSVDQVAEAFREEDAVTAVYTTADATVLVLGVWPPAHITDLIGRTVSRADYRDYDISIVTTSSPGSSLGTLELSVECAECGNPVTPEGGRTTRIDDTYYHFCCPVCENDFRDRYETLRERA